MRLLQVCPYDLTRPGGVQRHVLDLSAALAEAGHSVTVIAPMAGATAGDGVSLRTLGRSRSWGFHGTRFELTWASRAELREALAHIRSMGFDVAHFHTPWTPLMPWQLLRGLAGTVPRVVATFHDTPPPTLSGRLLRAAFSAMSRRLSAKLHAMVGVSESSAAHLRPRGGCPLILLPPCIDLRPCLALPAPDLERRAPTALFVGRLEPRKGVLLLIEAFDRVRRRHPEARLVICGDGEQRAAAEELSLRRALGDAVRFTGRLDEAAKLRLYGEATVFCAPSPYGESYGLVIAEAIAAGLPVVAAANPGYRSVLQGAGAEGLVSPNDSGALAEGLERVLSSPELRRRLSVWGRAQAPRSDVRARLPEFMSLYSSKGLGRA